MCNLSKPGSGQADINEPQAHGSTPLHGAAWGLHPAAVTALLEAGASTTVKNKYGLTALQETKQRKEHRDKCAVIEALFETVKPLQPALPRGPTMAKLQPMLATTLTACVSSARSTESFAFPPSLAVLIAEYALPFQWALECKACHFRPVGLRCVGFRSAEPQVKVCLSVRWPVLSCSLLGSTHTLIGHTRKRQKPKACQHRCRSRHSCVDSSCAWSVLWSCVVLTDVVRRMTRAAVGCAPKAAVSRACRFPAVRRLPCWRALVSSTKNACCQGLIHLL